MVTKMIAGLREVAQAGHVKTWLLDQFGVLHDGKKPYPGAVETLKFFCGFSVFSLMLFRSAVRLLASNGAKLVLLSNSSRRSEVTRTKLSQLGFDPGLFSGIITSGELTHQYLLERRDIWFSSLGRRCLHITWGARAAISLEGLNLEVVDDPAVAEFILVHGTEAIGTAGSVEAVPVSLEKLLSLMEVAVKRRLPMVVANPDIVTVEAKDLLAMPGTLGRKYEEMGGEVRWMGKPDPVIYRAAEEATGTGPGDCVAVGDSLEHDIQGAGLAGIRSVFVAGGIHAAELGMDDLEQQPCQAALETLLQKTRPDFVIPVFRW